MLPKTKFVVYGLVAILAVFVYSRFQHSSSADMSSSSEQYADWREFREAGGKFSSKMPSLPQHAAEAVPLQGGQGSIHYDMYLSQEKDGTTFMISQIQYPDSYETDATQLLDGVMQEMMRGHKDNVLKMKTTGQFQENNSLDFLIQNNDVYIRSRTFLHGKTLYVLTVIDRNIADLEAGFKKFSESFALGAEQK